MDEKAKFPITQKRLHSLDALRGFDMFWITGGGTLIAALGTRHCGLRWFGYCTITCTKRIFS